MLCMLLTGAANTLFMKYMDDTVIDEGPPKKKFTHPYMQSIIMFIGEFTCLGAYFIKIKCFKKKVDTEDGQ